MAIKRKNRKNLGNPALIASAIMGGKGGESPIPKPVIYVGLGIGAIILYKVFSGFQSVAEKIGLKDDKNDKNINAFEVSDLFKKAFNPLFYKGLSTSSKPKTLLVYKEIDAINMAKKIYDAKGFFNDNESVVIGVFRQQSSVATVSQLSDIFLRVYKQDLWAYLSFLDSAEKTQITNIINSLPLGVYAK